MWWSAEWSLFLMVDSLLRHRLPDNGPFRHTGILRRWFYCYHDTGSGCHLDIGLLLEPEGQLNKRRRKKMIDVIMQREEK